MIGFGREFGNFVIIAGVPNAGKSTATALLDLRGFKEVSADTWTEIVAKRTGADLTDPNVTHSLHSRHSKPAKAMLTSLMVSSRPENLPNVVWSTTGKTPSEYYSRVNSARSIGYVVTMVFVEASLETALARNRLRPRQVPEDMLKSAYQIAVENKGRYLAAADHAWIIYNEEASDNPVSLFRDGRRIRRIK